MEQLTPMYEYDQDSPRDRSRFWKLGLLVATFVATSMLVVDVIPVIQPITEYVL